MNDPIQAISDELSKLEASAKANPKEHFGNHVRGVGAGQKRVAELRAQVAPMLARLNDLNRPN